MNVGSGRHAGVGEKGEREWGTGEKEQVQQVWLEYPEYVLLGLLLGLGTSNSGRGSEPQDLRDGQGILLFLPQQVVAVLLPQVADHDVVVDTSLLRVVTLIYHHKGDLYKGSVKGCFSDHS